MKFLKIVPLALLLVSVWGVNFAEANEGKDPPKFTVAEFQKILDKSPPSFMHKGHEWVLDGHQSSEVDDAKAYLSKPKLNPKVQRNSVWKKDGKEFALYHITNVIHYKHYETGEDMQDDEAYAHITFKKK